MLSRQPWVERCLNASTVDECGAARERWTPHVAVIDLMLAGESGVDAIARLRAVAPGVRVLLISAARGGSLGGGGAHGWRRRLRRKGPPGRRHRARRAHGRVRALRLPAPGTVQQGECGSRPASSRCSRGSGAAPRTQRSRRAAPLAAHGQGAHERALPQARRAEPCRGRRASAAARHRRLVAADSGRVLAWPFRRADGFGMPERGPATHPSDCSPLIGGIARRPSSASARRRRAWRDARDPLPRSGEPDPG